MGRPTIPIVSGLFGWIEKEDMDFGLFIAIIGFLLVILSLSFFGFTENLIFSWIFALAPIWLPITTFSIFFWKYMDTVGKLYFLDQGRVTYEVIMPPEVYKSPEAMESVFTQIFNKATPDNLMETYLQGKRPQIFSFEIVSRGGEVKFYVNCPVKKGSRMLEAAFYAQYPGIELKQLEVDYTAEIPHNIPDHFVMSFHQTKGKDELPIRTYKELGLDDLPKEEEKVDPMVQMIEFMSKVRPYEQIWVQILCTAHRESSFKNGQLLFKPIDTRLSDVEAKIDDIMKRDSSTKAGPADIDGMPRITPGERELVELLERNMEKTAFSTAIRWMYITEPGKSNGDFFAGMLRSWAAYDVSGRDKLGPKWRTDFNYKFISDPFGKRLDGLRKQELKEYKLRKLFPKVPGVGGKLMTTEELATIWHPVGSVVMTPTLSRVSSTKHTAPSNLPIHHG